MSIESDVIAYFESVAALIAAFPPPPSHTYKAAIYPGFAGAGTPFPYVQVTDLGQPTPEYFGAPPGGTGQHGVTMFAHPAFKLQVFTEGKAAADTLGDLVYNTFMGGGLTLADGTTLAVYCDLGPKRMNEVRKSAKQLDVWQTVIHFRVLAQKAIA